MSTLQRHQEARDLATAAFKATFGRAPTLPEVQCVQGVGMLETSYGYGWSIPEAKGSYNIGAVIAGGSWRGATFEHRDSMPQDDGTNKWYVTRFRKYASALDGWTDFVRIMYANRTSVLEAATEGDVYGVSAALYETKYFFGFGATAEERIRRHSAKLLKCIAAQAQALGEPIPGSTKAPVRTLKRGMNGEDVKELQRELGLVADGIFGANTHAAVVAFQRQHNLTPDGVVGPKTWAAIDSVKDSHP